MSDSKPNQDQDHANLENSKAIGNYVIGKPIGEGTFGKVRSGTHLLTGEKVAIKILEKDRITDVADVERVSREIHILKIIRHPNIIQLYEIIETSKQLYLITEYISGGELFDYIVSCGKVKEKEACKFFQQIISGVEYIHKLNVVHRDLKPENLLLDFDKSIKVVDFGLSNTYKSGEKLKTACGSPCYAAPEMIAGKKYNGLQVDIWSCGVILFALLCGYLPFEDPNTAQLYKKILNGDYAIPNWVSPDAKHLIHGILNTDPQKRFTIEEIRKHQWYQISIPKEHKGIVIGEHQIPIDLKIIDEAVKLGLKKDALIRSLESNKHNHETATYYLLLKKHLRLGEISPANLNSDDCNPIGIGKAIISMRDTPKAENLIKLVNKDLHNFNSTVPRQPSDDGSKKHSIPNNQNLTVEKHASKKINLNDTSLIHRKPSPKNILNMTALGPININWVSNGKEPHIDMPRPPKRAYNNINIYNQNANQSINIKQVPTNSKAYSVTPVGPNRQRESSLQNKVPKEPTYSKPTVYFKRTRITVKPKNEQKKMQNYLNIYAAYHNGSERKKQKEKLNLTNVYEDLHESSPFNLKGAYNLNQTMNFSLINQRRAKSRDMSSRRKM